jgi:hypothetical protein
MGVRDACDDDTPALGKATYKCLTLVNTRPVRKIDAVELLSALYQVLITGLATSICSS